jgi:hypothetical protein
MPELLLSPAAVPCMQACQLLQVDESSPEMQSPQMQRLRQEAKKLDAVGYQQVLPVPCRLHAGCIAWNASHGCRVPSGWGGVPARF